MSRKVITCLVLVALVVVVWKNKAKIPIINKLGS